MYISGLTIAYTSRITLILQNMFFTELKYPFNKSTHLGSVATDKGGMMEMSNAQLKNMLSKIVTN